MGQCMVSYRGEHSRGVLWAGYILGQKCWSQLGSVCSTVSSKPGWEAVNGHCPSRQGAWWFAVIGVLLRVETDTDSPLGREGGHGALPSLTPPSSQLLAGQGPSGSLVAAEAT